MRYEISKAGFSSPVFQQRPNRIKLGPRFPRRWLSGSALLLAVLTSELPAGEWFLTGDLNAHDPAIVKEDGATPDEQLWWCAATGSGLAMKFSVDGIKWSPGLPLFRTETVQSWWTDYAPKMRPLSIWSPEIRKYHDRYWCYYSVSEFGKNNSAIGLTSTVSIFHGDWRRDGVVLSSHEGKDEFAAIDPHLAIDAEDKPWLAFGSYFDGLHIVALDPETMKPAAGATPTTIARRGRDLGLEGPAVIYANGYYYLFVSIDTCCNGKDSTSKIAFGRSKEITGPYEGKKGDEANAVSHMSTASLTILEKGDDRWAGVGGPCVYKYHDGWIMVRHGYDKNANGAQKLRINDLYWDEEGWPTYKARETASKVTAKP